jgi:choline-glycine betaine transporter
MESGSCSVVLDTYLRKGRKAEPALVNICWCVVGATRVGHCGTNINAFI